MVKYAVCQHYLRALEILDLFTTALKKSILIKYNLGLITPYQRSLKYAPWFSGKPIRLLHLTAVFVLYIERYAKFTVGREFYEVCCWLSSRLG